MVEAKLSRAWTAKTGVIGVILLAVAGWSLYDGLIVYPQENARYAVWDQLRQEQRMSDWPAEAEQRGWPVDEPEYHSDFSILTQYLMAGIGGVIGLVLLGSLATSLNKRLVADETGVVGPNGKRASYDAIQEIDRSRWAKKGIAVLVYEESGRRQSIKLDDVKFEGAAKVLDQVERQVNPQEPADVPAEGDKESEKA